MWTSDQFLYDINLTNLKYSKKNFQKITLNFSIIIKKLYWGKLDWSIQNQ